MDPKHTGEVLKWVFLIAGFELPDFLFQFCQLVAQFPFVLCPGRIMLSSYSLIWFLFLDDSAAMATEESLVEYGGFWKTFCSVLLFISHVCNLFLVIACRHLENQSEMLTRVQRSMADELHKLQVPFKSSWERYWLSAFTLHLSFQCHFDWSVEKDPFIESIKRGYSGWFGLKKGSLFDPER